MLNTHKLLYILPDLAYVAELLPAKKPNTFAIHNFRQINGEFLNDNEFIAENVLKLFTKLEPDTYHLVLPDFLFTNTIVSVKETGDSKVKKYLTDTLLPELSLTTDTHQVESFVLTELKGESKVQLSAIENTLLAALRVGAQQAKVKIATIVPLSWTLKSVISLEPSISVLQIGEYVYSSLQYIGVDQTNHAEVSEVETIGETIKTLKGAEPSIQTIYLLANAVVEERLKEQLSDTIPLQQLSSYKDDDSQMPSYVKDIIESGMKTLSIEEYPVPRFNLSAASAEEVSEFGETFDKFQKDTKSDSEKQSSGDNTKEDQTESSSETTDKEIIDSQDVDKDAENDTITTLPLPTPKPLLSSKPKTPALPDSSAPTPAIEAPTPATALQAELDQADDVDLTQFAQHATTAPETATDQSEPKTENSQVLDKDTPSEKPNKQKVVIKNSSGIGPMLKMIFITLAVFVATVAIGVGVGLGLLQFTNKEEVETTPVVVASPTPITSPSPTPEASPAAELDKEAFSILVVNATTRAGYAGTIRTLLTNDGFTDVDTGNADGEYEEEGIYILLSEANDQLIEALEEATDLTLISDDTLDKETEDPSDNYDAVIVLAE